MALKWAEKAKKVQKYHEMAKKGPKNVQKCLGNEPFYCKMNHCADFQNLSSYRRTLS